MALMIEKETAKPIPTTQEKYHTERPSPLSKWSNLFSSTLAIVTSREERERQIPYKPG